MDNYKQGYQKFRQQLAEGLVDCEAMRVDPQRPKTMVVTCCDSRVHPNQLFQMPAGHIFTYRNVAGLVPPYGQDQSLTAALELALSQLSINTLILLGHSQCAGVALMNKLEGLASTGPKVQQWLEAFTKAPANDFLNQPATEERALLRSLANCHSYPWLAERINAGSLQIKTMHFNLQSGNLRIYDQQAGRFVAFAE